MTPYLNSQNVQIRILVSIILQWWFFDWGGGGGEGNCPPCPPASYGHGYIVHENFFHIPSGTEHEIRGLRELIIFLGVGVPPGPKNPYLISDQNIRFSIPYFRPCIVWQFRQFSIGFTAFSSYAPNDVRVFFLRDAMPAATCYC